jgi:hypothetical protein
MTNETLLEQLAYGCSYLELGDWAISPSDAEPGKFVVGFYPPAGGQKAVVKDSFREAVEYVLRAEYE